MENEDAIKIFISNTEIIKFYLKEISNLKKHKIYLSLVFLVGRLSETIAQLISEAYTKIADDIFNTKIIDSDAKLYKLLGRHLKKNRITLEQFNIFNKIREIRNKHTHLNLYT